MPQQNPQANWAPGSDTLIKTLNTPAPEGKQGLSDGQKQAIWDAYQTKGDEKAWVDGINKAFPEWPDENKQMLYDIRWKQWNNPTKAERATGVPEYGQVPKTPTASKQPGSSAFNKGDNRQAPEPSMSQKALDATIGFGQNVVKGFKESVVDFLTEPYKQGYRDPLSYATELAGNLGEGVKSAITDREARLAGVLNAPDASWKTWEGVKYNIGKGAEATGHAATLFMDVPTLGMGEMVKGAAETAQEGRYGESVGQAAGIFVPERLEHIAKQAGVRALDKVSQSRNAGDLTGKSTPVGPIDTPATKPQETMVSKAPDDVRATQAPASKTADPQMWIGKENPMRPYDPGGKRFAKGPTIGMEPLDTAKLSEMEKGQAPKPSDDSLSFEDRSPESRRSTIVAARLALESNEHPTMDGWSIKLPGGSTLGSMLKFLGVKETSEGNFRIEQTPQNIIIKNQLIDMLKGMESDLSKPKEEGPLGGINASGYEASLRPVTDEDKAQTIRVETEDLKAKIRNGQGTVEEREQAAQRIEENNQLLLDFERPLSGGEPPKALPAGAPESVKALADQLPASLGDRVGDGVHTPEDENYIFQQGPFKGKRLGDVLAASGGDPSISERIKSELADEPKKIPTRGTETQMDKVQNDLGHALAKNFDNVEFRGVAPPAGDLPAHLVFQDNVSGSSLMVPLNEADFKGMKSRLDFIRQAMALKPMEGRFDLPPLALDAIEHIADAKEKMDTASEDKYNDLKLKTDNAERNLGFILDRHASLLSPKNLAELRDWAQQKVKYFSKYANLTRWLTDQHLKNKGLSDDLSETMATGGRARILVINEMGDRAFIKPSAEAGVAFRAVVHEAQGKVPRFEYVFKGVPEGVNAADWTKRAVSAMEEKQRIVDEMTHAIEYAKETGSDYRDNIDVKDWQERIKAIDDEFGKYVNKEPWKKAVSAKGKLMEPIGRRPYVKPSFDEDGVLKVEEKIPRWTTARLEAVFGKGRFTDKIPDESELYRKADKFQDLADLHSKVADTAQKYLDARDAAKKQAERGSIGEVRLRSTMEPQFMVPARDEALQNAKNAGIKVTAISLTQDKSAPWRAWISPDGKYAVEVSDVHDHTAWEMLGRPEGITGNDPSKALHREGWIAKSSVGAYRVGGGVSSSSSSIIEGDLILNRATNRPVAVDVVSPTGKVRSLTVYPGWDNFEDALRKEARREQWVRQQNQGGKVSSAVSLTGMAAGAAIGTAVGGIPGGTLGMFVGFTLPSVVMSAPVRSAMARVGRFVPNVVSWFNGIPQLEHASDPVMRGIRDEQNMHSNRTTSFFERLRQLPADIYKGFDQFAFAADRNNMSNVGRLMMSLDKRGEVFRSLKLPDEKSFYLALREAGSKALGQRWFQNMLYRDVIADANQAGLSQHLISFFNYKGYERVFQVLNEHIRDLDQDIQQKRQQLQQNPNMGVVQANRLRDSLADTLKMKDEIMNKIANREAVPGGYSPQSLAAAIRAQEVELGPAKHRELVDLAQRVFQGRERVLRMIHSQGLITDELYHTLQARGPEYVPMQRIVDDLAQYRASGDDRTVPLHLRHQTVIRTLEGSTRTNVNPWEAFSQVDARAFGQIYRNDTMRHLVELRGAYPNLLGPEVKEVQQGYVPKAGEALVGYYEAGKPKLYAVGEYLGKTLEQYPLAARTMMGGMAKWFSTSWKHAATVLNIHFQAASFLGHALSGAILSPSNAEDVGRFVKGFAKSVASVMKEDQAYREMIRSGAGFGTYSRMIDPERAVGPQTLGWKGVFKASPIDSMQRFAGKLEDINRLNTFSNARLAGHNVEAAAREAKFFGGAPDFSRMGDVSQPLNQVLMFLNAHIQYLNQAATAIKKDPARVLGTLAATGAIVLALQHWNSQQKDADGNDQLRKVPINERQRNFVVLLPWDRQDTGKAYQINIPKPYGVQLIANPMEEAFGAITGKEQRTGEQQVLDTIGGLSPLPLRMQQGRVASTLAQSAVSSLHPLVKTAVEQFANTDDFGRPIVPASEQNIAPGEQFGPTTPTTAQAIGRGGVPGAAAGAGLGGSIGYLYGGAPGAAVGTLAGGALGASGRMSPRRVASGAGTLFAGAATQAESYLDPFFAGIKVMKNPTAYQIARQAPVVGSTIKRFTGSDINQEEITLSQQLDVYSKSAIEAYNTAKHYEQIDPQKSAKWVQDHSDELWKAGVVNQLQTKLREISHNERAISANQSFTDEDKMNMIRKLRDLRITMLRIGVQMIKPSPQVGQASAFPGNAQGSPR